MEITPEEQYRQAYTSFRHHDTLILQTISIVITLNAGIIFAAYTINWAFWWVQDILIFLGMLLTFALTHANIKNRYFHELDQNTITKIEGEFAQKRIQRSTIPLPDGTNKEFWAKAENPDWLQKHSTHKIYIRVMLLIILIQYVLLVMNPLLASYNIGSMAGIIITSIVGFLLGLLLLIKIFKAWKLND